MLEKLEMFVQSDGGLKAIWTRSTPARREAGLLPQAFHTTFCLAFSQRQPFPPFLSHSGKRLLYICITNLFSCIARRHDGWDDVSTFSPTEG